MVIEELSERRSASAEQWGLMFAVHHDPRRDKEFIFTDSAIRNSPFKIRERRDWLRGLRQTPSASRTRRSVKGLRLSQPGRDSNPDWMDQNHLCYHYTTRLVKAG